MDPQWHERLISVLQGGHSPGWHRIGQGCGHFGSLSWKKITDKGRNRVNFTNQRRQIKIFHDKAIWTRLETCWIRTSNQKLQDLRNETGEYLPYHKGDCTLRRTRLFSTNGLSRDDIHTCSNGYHMEEDFHTNYHKEIRDYLSIPSERKKG